MKLSNFLFASLTVVVVFFSSGINATTTTTTTSEVTPQDANPELTSVLVSPDEEEKDEQEKELHNNVRRLGSWTKYNCLSDGGHSKDPDLNIPKCDYPLSANDKAAAKNLANIACCDSTKIQGEKDVGFKVKKYTNFLGLSKWKYKCCTR